MNRIIDDWQGKSVLDFGCKNGQMFPLFHSFGASRIIGVEIEDEYLEQGRKTIGKFYDSVSYVEPENIGYIPIDQEEITIDEIIINEVISHINPMFLDIVLMELARIFKIGGLFFISDGNNFEFLGYRDKQFTLYELWENCPDGAKTDRDIVTKSYQTRRKEIILKRHSDMPEENVLHLAKNTSGLWSEYLNQATDSYSLSKKLTKRPYRNGTCPVNPASSGVVMERVFFPQSVEYMLYEKGLKPAVIPPPGPLLSNYKNRRLGLLKYAVRSMQYAMPNLFCSDWRYKGNEGFQVMVRKEF